MSEIDDLPQAEVQPEAGSINLNSLDLTSKKAIAKLAATYKSAMSAGLTCIPFFADCRMSRREHYSTALAKSQGIVSETISLFEIWQPGMSSNDLFKVVHSTNA